MRVKIPRSPKKGEGSAVVPDLSSFIKEQISRSLQDAGL